MENEQESTQLDELDALLERVRSATSDDLHLLRDVTVTLVARVRHLEELINALFGDTSEA